MDNLVLESIFYNETSKPPLLFEIVLRLKQVQMRGELILHDIKIAGTRTIEVGIERLSRGNNLGGIMRGINLCSLYRYTKVR